MQLDWMWWIRYSFTVPSVYVSKPFCVLLSEYEFPTGFFVNVMVKKPEHLHIYATIKLLLEKYLTINNNQV